VTLIITSIRPRDIVMTSDSRATLMMGNILTGDYDKYQKIFPMPDHPIVIGHHGENDLGSMPLSRFIEGFYAKLNAGNLTMLEVGDELRTYAHPAVRKRLRAISGRLTGCGFLIAGFSPHEKGPSVVEIFWSVHKEALVNEERQWRPIAVIPSGSGQKQITGVEWRAIADKPLEQVEAYNESLIEQAKKSKMEHNPVGGPIQEVAVTREGWKWAPGKAPVSLHGDEPHGEAPHGEAPHGEAPPKHP
jgi:hypothetical protein